MLTSVLVKDEMHFVVIYNALQAGEMLFNANFYERGH